MFARAVQIFRYWVDQMDNPPIEMREKPGQFEVIPTIENSFSVGLELANGELIAYNQQWHMHTDDPIEAASVLYWMLTPFTRIVYEMKAGKTWVSWIENYEADGWDACTCVYFLNPVLDESWTLAPGQSFERHTLQQDVLRWSRSIDEIRPGVVLNSEGLPVDSFLGDKIEVATESLAHRPRFEP